MSCCLIGHILYSCFKEFWFSQSIFSVNIFSVKISMDELSIAAFKLMCTREP